MDPEAARAKNNAYRAANPEKMAVWDKRKRALRRGAPRIKYTAAQLAAKIAYWGNKCWMCGGPVESIDHVKPVTKGGWDALCNLRPACSSCNSSKRNKWPFPVTHKFLTAA